MSVALRSSSWELDALPRQAIPIASCNSLVRSSLGRRGVAPRAAFEHLNTADGSFAAFSLVKQLLGTAADVHHEHFWSAEHSASVLWLVLHASSSCAWLHPRSVATTRTDVFMATHSRK